ncbi:hypothetical protein [Nocardioides litoris]|uniref:hypothetical protein n=1 Tax=Nocardioides litoris TaxID=1926648 RepID=UPI00111E6E70|nr:hypothetical protein [Nocardioides litoris]
MSRTRDLVSPDRATVQMLGAAVIGSATWVAALVAVGAAGGLWLDQAGSVAVVLSATWLAGSATLAVAPPWRFVAAGLALSAVTGPAVAFALLLVALGA